LQERKRLPAQAIMMVDKFSKKTRSRIMSRVRSQDTKCELRPKADLEALGFEYQVSLIGIKIDYVHVKEKIALFIDGCFWHCCLIHGNIPASNTDYWIPKLRRNAERDIEKTRKLLRNGVRVIRIWEHSIMKGEDLSSLMCLISSLIDEKTWSVVII